METVVTTPSQPEGQPQGQPEGATVVVEDTSISPAEQKALLDTWLATLSELARVATEASAR